MGLLLIAGMIVNPFPLSQQPSLPDTSSATLQLLSPSGGEAKTNPKPQGAPTGKDAKGDEAPTKAAPSIVNGKLSAKETEAKAAENTTDQNTKAAEDWWTMIGTVGSGVFTGLLFLVACIQACFFWWQLKLIRDGADDTKSSADAARKAAIATGESSLSGILCEGSVSLDPSTRR